MSTLMSNFWFTLLFTLLLSTRVFTHEIPKGEKTPTKLVESQEIKGSTSDSSPSYQLKDFQPFIPSMKPKAQKHYDYRYGYYYYYPNNYQLDGLNFRIDIPDFKKRLFLPSFIFLLKILFPNLPIEQLLLFPDYKISFYTTRMNIPASNYYQPNIPSSQSLVTKDHNIQSFGYQPSSSLGHIENLED
ncbi:hypothetical protein PIB30_057013 [Stylosanthes scabra]|uniref:Uncharacterized protein n=1 Tax=Stylosanthes scabra TaxID=79078 RepID=A0ABU6YLC9_9FABA|nr:hypothetical protein [Stylosanthes scabra]